MTVVVADLIGLVQRKPTQAGWRDSRDLACVWILCIKEVCNTGLIC